MLDSLLLPGGWTVGPVFQLSSSRVLERYFFVFQFVLDVGPKLEPSCTKNIKQQLVGQMWRWCPVVPRRNSMGISHPCLFLRFCQKSKKCPMIFDWFWLQHLSSFKHDQAGCDDIPAVLAAGSIHPFVGSSRGTGNTKHICNEEISTLQHGGLRTRT